MKSRRRTTREHPEVRWEAVSAPLEGDWPTCLPWQRERSQVAQAPLEGGWPRCLPWQRERLQVAQAPLEGSWPTGLACRPGAVRQTGACRVAGGVSGCSGCAGWSGCSGCSRWSGWPDWEESSRSGPCTTLEESVKVGTVATGVVCVGRLGKVGGGGEGDGVERGGEGPTASKAEGAGAAGPGSGVAGETAGSAGVAGRLAATGWAGETVGPAGVADGVAATGWAGETVGAAGVAEGVSEAGFATRAGAEAVTGRVSACDRPTGPDLTTLGRSGPCRTRGASAVTTISGGPSLPALAGSAIGSGAVLGNETAIPIDASPIAVEPTGRPIEAMRRMSPAITCIAITGATVSRPSMK